MTRFGGEYIKIPIAKSSTTSYGQSPVLELASTSCKYDLTQFGSIIMAKPCGLVIELFHVRVLCWVDSMTHQLYLTFNALLSHPFGC